MRKIECLILAIIIVFSSIRPALAKEKGEAGAAGAYLRIGVGARPLGMGGSFVAISDDAYATYWNPAGLIQINKPQIGSMYALMSYDRKYSFLNYAQPVGKNWAFGISWMGFGIDEIEMRDSFGNLLGKTKDTENAYYLSLSKKFGSLLSLGANMKYLTHQVAGKKATGFGSDAGVLLNLTPNFSLGLLVQDIWSFLKWDTESKHKENIPLNIRCGVATRLLNERLILSSDVEKNRFQALKLHFGAEYWLSELLALRVGYDDKEITAGVGIKTASFCFDYGFCMDKMGAEHTHRISILFFTLK